MKRLHSFCIAFALCVGLCCGFTRAAAPAPLHTVCSTEEWELLKLTNQQRLAQGLTPYSTFSNLQNAVATRKSELVSSYSHTRPNGSSCFTALTESGLSYRSAGENIAAGQRSVQAVTDAWMASADHRANILDSGYTHMGTGYAASGFLGTSWVQMFLDCDCSISSISLSSNTVTCKPGTSIDDLDLYIVANCSVHGDCYLPLTSGLCNGYDPNHSGTQTVTVTYAGQSATLRVLSSNTPLDTSSADTWALNWLARADELNLLSPMNRQGFTTDITRLQFADLAVNLAEQLIGKEIPLAPINTFSDTSDEVVRKAKQAGIASGYATDDGFVFRPSNPITRQELCVMLAHVVDYVEAQRGAVTINRNTTIQNTFPDRDEVADWAVVQVALMTNNPVMGGKATASGTLLMPLANTTLQEAATLTVKLYDLLK